MNRHQERLAFCLKVEGVPVAERTLRCGCDSHAAEAGFLATCQRLFDAAQKRLRIKAPIGDHIPADVFGRLAMLLPGELTSIYECGGEAAIWGLVGDPHDSYSTAHQRRLAGLLLDCAIEGTDLTPWPQRASIRTWALRLLPGSHGRLRVKVTAKLRDRPEERSLKVA